MLPCPLNKELEAGKSWVLIQRIEEGLEAYMYLTVARCRSLTYPVIIFQNIVASLSSFMHQEATRVVRLRT